MIVTRIARRLILVTVMLCAVAATAAAQQHPDTFRSDVELLLVRVQVRADRGHSLPTLGPADFTLRVGKRTPQVLHAERVTPTDTERRRFSWPKDEAAAMYVIGVDANISDCRQMPKVSVLVAHVKARGLAWSPGVDCIPRGLTIR